MEQKKLEDVSSAIEDLAPKILNLNLEYQQIKEKFESLEQRVENLKRIFSYPGLCSLKEQEINSAGYESYFFPIRPFASSSQSGDPILHLNRYNSIANIKKWDENKKRSYFGCTLQREAINRVPTFKISWDELKTSFIKIFSEKDDSHSKYESFKYVPNRGSIAKFIDKKIKLGRKAIVKDEIIIKDIIRKSNIPTRYVMFLLHQNPTLIFKLRSLFPQIKKLEKKNIERKLSKLNNPVKKTTKNM